VAAELHHSSPAVLFPVGVINEPLRSCLSCSSTLYELNPPLEEGPREIVSMQIQRCKLDETDFFLY
jgi:hypothetical protein